MYNKKCVLGIDTSNYTTSVAIVDDNYNIIADERKKLTVKQGDRGLRQSNALFQHIENIPELIYDAFSKNIEGCELTLVSVSSKPRPLEGSYMPVFKAGISAGNLINDDQKVGRYIGLKDKIERKELLDILSSMKIGNIFYKKIDLDKGNLIAYVNDKLVIKGEIKAVVKAAKSKKLSKILFDLYKKKKMEGTIILSDNEYSVYSPQTYKEVKVKE